jgi:hypothetical protein
LPHLLCTGGIISLSWFSKELNDLSKNNWLRGVIFILLIRELIFVGWGFSFPIVLVSRYKLFLCHTLIKPNLLGFSGIGVFECGLLDCVFKRFTSLWWKMQKTYNSTWLKIIWNSCKKLKSILFLYDEVLKIKIV